MITPLPVANLSASDCNTLCNWASVYGAAVRQRTVRQEATMAKHGTLPEFVYQHQLAVGEKVTLNFGFDEDEYMDEADQSEDASNSDEGHEG